MQKRTTISLIVAFCFLVGTGAILYFGRPVMRLNELQENTTDTSQTTLETSTDITSKTPSETTPENTSETTITATDADITPSENTLPAKEEVPESGTYTSAQVATHVVKSNCWASINDSVYDLSSWVSRHPGGEKFILNLCGTDATAAFSARHGGSKAAKAALTLLKIGTLSE